ncbi:MAG: hypothetical protein DHS20C11_26510 [Lysobacteraceae bacterium]|nr:MAG: hypothetical protein DHS20C11_26510 [Xanthomonadaceae bacterium]
MADTFTGVRLVFDWPGKGNSARDFSELVVESLRVRTLCVASPDATTPNFLVQAIEIGLVGGDFGI